MLGRFFWHQLIMARRLSDSEYPGPSRYNEQVSCAKDDDQHAPTPPLPQSISSPSLLKDESHALLRRTQSYLGLSEGLTVRKRGSISATMAAPSRNASFTGFTEALESSSRAASSASRSCKDVTTVEKEEMVDQYDGAAELDTHLHTMNISHQLRSMSQLSHPSEPTETDSLLSLSLPWNKHSGMHSDAGGFSAHTRHSREQSSTGMESTTVPTAWGRVKSPAVSSIYSRPSSAGEASQTEQAGAAAPMPYEIPNDLDAMFVDWPLKPTADVTEGKPLSEPGAGELLPSTAPDLEHSASTPYLNATATDEASVKWLSPPEQRAGSIPSKGSSSTLTKQSKTSRFLERFSPPKKTVRKRRSIFKFLRPGSRRQQPRSISTPVLREITAQPVASYDGHIDDPGLLSVQYELPDYPPQKSMRAASMNNLSPHHKDAAASLLSVPSPLQRRPTLVDYERSLTVAGDDRRKPSTVNLHLLKEVHEDDHKQSVTLHRKLSRAKPLHQHEDTSGLMAQALRQHQEEKALFRSASKQRESLGHSLGHSLGVPSLYTGTVTTAGSSRPRPSSLEDDSLLGPMDHGDVSPGPSQVKGSQHLRPPPSPFTGPLSRSRSASSTAAGRRGPASASSYSFLGQRRSTTKIGTSLASWSRYPSHTRADRSGAAGPADHVVARDFAIDVHPADLHDAAEHEPDTPKSKRTVTSKHSAGSLPRSRSSVFLDVVRYYGNLFTTGGSTAQNRRTSVTTSGWLQHPDLEMLPPITASEPHFPHHDHHFKEHLHQLEQHFEEHMKHDIEQVEAEAAKLIYHPNRRHANSGSSSEGSPFRQGSIFGQSSGAKRASTFVGPNDELDEEIMPTVVHAPTIVVPAVPVPGSHSERNVALDGVVEDDVQPKKPSPSKADEWSALYKECLIRPKASHETVNEESEALLPSAADSNFMPPPALKPVKPRSPEQPKRLDAHASIRRFPSVTVIDDRKGHSRSVSLISVRVDNTGGIMRSSTNDLLQLIEAKEREEREKLLSGSGLAL